MVGRTPRTTSSVQAAGCGNEVMGVVVATFIGSNPLGANRCVHSWCTSSILCEFCGLMDCISGLWGVSVDVGLNRDDWMQMI